MTSAHVEQCEKHVNVHIGKPLKCLDLFNVRSLGGIAVEALQYIAFRINFRQ